MPDTIMKCERTDHWIKMRPSRARSSAQAASCHILSSVDFITSTFESEFLVHTGHTAPPRPDEPPLSIAHHRRANPPLALCRWLPSHLPFVCELRRAFIVAH